MVCSVTLSASRSARYLGARCYAAPFPHAIRRTDGRAKTKGPRGGPFILCVAARPRALFGRDRLQASGFFGRFRHRLQLRVEAALEHAVEDVEVDVDHRRDVK